MRHAIGLRMAFARILMLAAALAWASGCAQDTVGADDVAGDDAPELDGGPTGPDADTGDGPCDLTGLWIVEQHTVAIALSTDQNTTNWYYYRIVDSGDRFTVETGLNCGFVVDGTTTVTLDDATLGALAKNEAASNSGRGGTFKPTADGTACEFAFDRSYNLRGANKAMYLTDSWQIGDPPKPLGEFPALPTAPPGMEDWDADNMHGITLRSGLGNRYVAQRDWNEHVGTVPPFAAAFGGEGVVTVPWDTQEGISTQTGVLLRVSATPDGDGWARWARADGTLTVVTEGDTAELQTCRNVQQLAQQTWP